MMEQTANTRLMEAADTESIRTLGNGRQKLMEVYNKFREIMEKHGWTSPNDYISSEIERAEKAYQEIVRTMIEKPEEKIEGQPRIDKLVQRFMVLQDAQLKAPISGESSYQEKQEDYERRNANWIEMMMIGEMLWDAIPEEAHSARGKMDKYKVVPEHNGTVMESLAIDTGTTKVLIHYYYPQTENASGTVAGNNAR